MEHHQRSPNPIMKMTSCYDHDHVSDLVRRRHLSCHRRLIDAYIGMRNPAELATDVRRHSSHQRLAVLTQGTGHVLTHIIREHPLLADLSPRILI
jgi:hypothetical protein